MQPPPGRPRIPTPSGGASIPPPPRPAVQVPPPPPQQAYAPPAAAPWNAPQPAAGPAPWNAPSPALAAQALQRAPRLGKSRGFLKFFAVTCSSTAWVTLVLSVLMGIGTIGMAAQFKGWMGGMNNFINARTHQQPGASTMPGVDAPDLGMGGLGDSGGGGDLGGMGGGAGGSQGLQLMMVLAPFAGPIIGMIYLSGVLTVLSGIVMWLMFIGLAKLTYGYLDLEEQATRDHDAVQILLAGLPGRPA